MSDIIVPLKPTNLADKLRTYINRRKAGKTGPSIIRPAGLTPEAMARIRAESKRGR